MIKIILKIKKNFYSMLRIKLFYIYADPVKKEMKF